MSKIKFTIDTQDADGIAKVVKMLQAINGPTTVSATVTEETETEGAAEEQQQPEKKERKPRQPRKPVEETKTETEEVETEEATEEQPEKKETPKGKSNVSLDELRTLLSEKVTDHRELIKNKLKELGAASVSTLSEDKYEEFFNFLDFL